MERAVVELDHIWMKNEKLSSHPPHIFSPPEIYFFALVKKLRNVFSDFFLFEKKLRNVFSEFEVENFGKRVPKFLFKDKIRILGV
jgi:hypothetical protein